MDKTVMTFLEERSLNEGDLSQRYDMIKEQYRDKLEKKQRIRKELDKGNSQRCRVINGKHRHFSLREKERLCKRK